MEMTDFLALLDTLDLSLANMALLVVLLARYRDNKINRLSLADSAVNTAYYAMAASLMLANKYLNDQSYTLKTWLSILAKTCPRLSPTLLFLNQLEAHFLAAVGFSVGTSHDPALWDSFGHLDRYWLAQLRAQVEKGASPAISIPPPPPSSVPLHLPAPVAHEPARPAVSAIPTPPSVQALVLYPAPQFPLVQPSMAPVLRLLPAYCLGQQLQSQFNYSSVPTPPTLPPSMPRADYVPMTPMLVGRKRRKVEHENYAPSNSCQQWYGLAPVGAPMGVPMGLHKNY